MGCGGVVRRAYVFRMRPTVRQHIALRACVEAHRELYNAALQERRDGWSHNKTRISYGDQSSHRASADQMAARNILRAGLALHAQAA
ncbi:helix-turn-helix domain-containing protein [Mycobacterium sp.]|uniref:helix-turn-helix domain-containing protein n=1 Tax=Mycobacterium sp. TaxID=1785 RepID=UPI003C707EFD